MASTFVADKAAAGVQPKAGIDLCVAYGTYEIAAALVANDVIKLCKIPAGATALDVVVGADDLDSATTLVLDVGDTGDAERFIANSDLGQSAGIARMAVMKGFLHKYASDDYLCVKVSTAPGSGATSGTISGYIMYTMAQ